MAKRREGGEMNVYLNGVIDSMPVFAKELIAGGVAGGVAKTVVAPLERIKILFQTRRSEYQCLGLFGSVKKIAKTEGPMGFYRGNGASVVRIVPYAALHYMSYEQYRRWIILAFPEGGRGPVLDLVAGSLSGGTAVLFTYPLDLVRTKLAYQVVGSPKLQLQGIMTSGQLYKGIVDCFSKTYKEAGLRGLYRGVAPSLYGIFPYAGLKFYFYEEMKRYVPPEQKNSIMVKLVCGSVAGLLGQTITYPLDVVRRQMQVHRLLASNSLELKGTMESLVLISKMQGWKQLFSGLSINYLKVVPSVAIGFTVYDVMKAHLRVPSRDEPAKEVVNGKFTSDQSLIYNAVLDAHNAVISTLKPGVSWVDMHKLAEKVILESLKRECILDGIVDDMMVERLGAVFMPHGLGHLLGIDTHDPGGYLKGPERINEPGLKSLRTAREMQEGMVITVEPGCYFIDALLVPAMGSPNTTKFFNHAAVGRFKGFGGVRIESDVLITANGCKNMTKVPREIGEIEAVMAGAPWPLDRAS